MSAHTPGPWEWWTSNSWRRLRHSDRGVSTNVLYPCVHRDGQADIDVSPEDMALIKAAPDLLAALGPLAMTARTQADVLRHQARDATSDVTRVLIKAAERWETMHDIATAAITKATTPEAMR